MGTLEAENKPCIDDAPPISPLFPHLRRQTRTPLYSIGGMASDPDDDGGEVAPVEDAAPAEVASDPSPSAEVAAPESEPAKAGAGSIVPAAAAESSHPEGLSLNYEVRINLTVFVLFRWPDH